ncbi:MAG: DUF6220 domain-containing protein [Nocardioidaceae bacterium]
MTDTSTPSAPLQQPEPTLGGFRRGTMLVFRVVGAVALAAMVVQIVFAGLGAYGASFDAHRVLGGIIGMITVLMLILVLVGRPNWLTVGLTVLLVALAVPGQSVLANLGDDTDAWFGGIHALNGMVIMGLTSRVAFGAKGRSRAGAEG